MRKEGKKEGKGTKRCSHFNGRSTANSITHSNGRRSKERDLFLLPRVSLEEKEKKKKKRGECTTLTA